MKKLIFVLSLGLIIGMININKAEAQVHISVNINVQPAWGPSGYDYAEFYYIPEIDIYYDVVNQLFYYHNRGRWRTSRFLPAAYSYYDFYSLYKVVLNGVHHPWKYNKRHRNLYVGYRQNYHQVPIYYMKEHRYQHARNNYHGWVEPRYMPRNSGRPANREFSTNTPRNGRISNDLRSSGSGNRGESVNRSTSSRNEAAMNNRGNSRNDGRNNSEASNRSNDNSRSTATTARSTGKKESNVATGNRSSNTRSDVSRNSETKNNNSSVSSRSGNRSAESTSSRSTKEKRSDRSQNTRSSRK